MPSYNVKIKWGKQIVDVECNMDELPHDFKSQIFSVTGVPPERQKIMTKGGILKDDDWGKVEVKEGMQMMMMGSADDLPSEPASSSSAGAGFSSGNRAGPSGSLDPNKINGTLPLGIGNLGNTCYMNATLQCLQTVPELRLGLERYTDAGNGALPTALIQARLEDSSLTGQLRDFYRSLQQGRMQYGSAFLLTALHRAYPQFAQRNDKGELSQQDAFELWTNLMGVLHDRIAPLQPNEAHKEIEFITALTDPVGAGQSPPVNNNSPGAKTSGSGNVRYRNLIDQYFGMEFEQVIECKDDADDKSTTTEFSTQLNCHIDQGVKYLHSSLRKWSGDGETITKKSPKLDREVDYKVARRFTRLPGYLTLQLVRFFYKTVQKTAGSEGVSAKILKDVKFPVMLDLYDFCTDSLKKQLSVQREKFRLQEERRVEKAVEKVQNLEKTEKNKPIDKTGLTAAGLAKGAKVEPFWLLNDLGSNNSGYYELQAVLTHQGRSSNSGHYVAWTKYRPGEWLKFDDEDVTVVSEEDVLRLSGGGDWHMAYVLLYGPRLLEHAADDNKTAAAGVNTNNVKTDDKSDAVAKAKVASGAKNDAKMDTLD